jgi:hypothetical protein
LQPSWEFQFYKNTLKEQPLSLLWQVAESCTLKLINQTGFVMIQVMIFWVMALCRDVA